MKKLQLILASLFLVLLFSSSASAQQKSFFIGKWNVTVVGTPKGDAKILVEFVAKDSTTLTGSITDPATQKVTKIDRIELKDKSITAYFNAEGTDIYLFLEKKDEDKVTGSLMDMFDASGSRVK
jgi:acetyl-CoA carboxylase carboxyltransferase component